MTVSSIDPDLEREDYESIVTNETLLRVKTGTFLLIWRVAAARTGVVYVKLLAPEAAGLSEVDLVTRCRDILSHELRARPELAGVGWCVLHARKSLTRQARFLVRARGGLDAMSRAIADDADGREIP